MHLALGDDLDAGSGEGFGLHGRVRLRRGGSLGVDGVVLRWLAVVAVGVLGELVLLVGFLYAETGLDL